MLMSKNKKGVEGVMAITNEDFQAVKQCLRENGYLPTKKLILEFYEQTEKELNHLTSVQFDQHSEEESRQRLWEAEQELAKVMGAMSRYTHFY